jgi:MoaA/NifB/PqqE/SkfB family radical SAM enzyme
MKLLDFEVGLPDVKAHAVRNTAAAAARILPFIPDKVIISLAQKHISKIRHEEGRIFMEQLLLHFKRTLPRCAESVRRKFASNLLANLVISVEQAREFKEKHGIMPPDFLVISPSMRCNLKCNGCYSGEYVKHRGLEFELIDRILGEAKEMGIYFIVISGGEPFLRKDLFDVFSKHDDIFYQVYTNGTLIDDDVADRLAELGNVLPCISVEGFETETDSRRGEGTFARITAAMDRLRERGVLFGFSVTVTRQNNELVVSDEFVDFFVEKGAFLGWYFNYIPIGRKPALDLMPTPEQRNYRRERIFELRKEKPIILADFWNDGLLTGGCISSGRVYVHINANGDVEPCVFAQFTVDNIREKSLAEALDSEFFCTLRSKQPFNRNHYRPCMIIDNPHVLREAVMKCGARPSYPEAMTLLTELAEGLDRYAEEYGKLADEAWEKTVGSGEAGLKEAS